MGGGTGGALPDDLIPKARALVRAGQKAEAQKLLEPFIEANPHQIPAWLLEVETWPKPADKIKVLELGLKHNPEAAELQQALAALKANRRFWQICWAHLSGRPKRCLSICAAPSRRATPRPWRWPATWRAPPKKSPRPRSNSLRCGRPWKRSGPLAKASLAAPGRDSAAARSGLQFPVCLPGAHTPATEKRRPPMKLLIQHGTLVTAADTFAADLLVEDGRIARLGQDLPAGDAEVVDATGLLVLPGGLDAHTHLDLPTSGTVASDDFYTGHKAAAFGGTTTHIDFAIQPKGGSLRDGLEAWHRKAENKAVIDYAFHANLTDFNEQVLDEIPWLAAEGVTSLKVLLAYKGVLQVDDTALFRSLMLAAQAGVLMLVHAENGDAIDVLVKDAITRGRTGLEWHARTRPAWLEAEATLRASALAAAAGAPLYIVHMSSGLAVDQLAYARAHGLSVMGETCPQYLFFTEDDLKRPDGVKWLCSPPLRAAADQARLWTALHDHTLQTVATDHCPFFVDGTRAIEYEGQLVAIPGKELGGGQFQRTPNGVPGLGDRLLVLWERGVNTGRLSPNRFVELTATNPAKIFGLYPRKGTLAVGADADLALWDPRLKKTLGVATSHQRTDYNLYEGWEITGWPVKVYRRGELLVDGDTWHGRPGSGLWLKRGPGMVI